MSFITKIGQDMEKDKKLVVMRKKYFHNILEFNQVWQQEKRETTIKQKLEADSKIFKMNLRALELLEMEKQQRLNEKLDSQQNLKWEYQKQIQQKKEKKKLEKQIDKTFIKLQEIETDKASDRRVKDLMKIYERPTVTNTLHRRVKTETLSQMDNPEQSKPEFTANTKKTQPPASFLPPIEAPKAQNASLKELHKQVKTISMSMKSMLPRTLF